VAKAAGAAGGTNSGIGDSGSGGASPAQKATTFSPSQRQSAAAKKHAPHEFHSNKDPDDLYELMSIKEIMLGKNNGSNSVANDLKAALNSDDDLNEEVEHDAFPGLIPLCKIYLEFIGVDCVTWDKINKYLDFIALRASGKIMTNAQYIRRFVRTHESYKRDSVVPQEAAFDLLVHANAIGQGLIQAPELLGPYCVLPVCRPA